MFNLENNETTQSVTAPHVKVRRLAPSNIFQKIMRVTVNWGLCDCSDEYGTSSMRQRLYLLEKKHSERPSLMFFFIPYMDHQTIY